MVPDLVAFADEIRQAGYTHALLLGMGGSSLAPEVMRLVSRVAPGYLNLTILDSTDPAQVVAAAHRSPVKRTLYIVSSKSGGTAEVNAFMDYFWARARKAVGKSAAEHFIAITDPGTSLEKIARERHFRCILLADPTIGGRYSALSAFGLVPASLLGLDVEHLLNQASRMYHECTPEQPAVCNPGLVLGTVLGEAALNGRDKLTLIADPRLTAFGSWLEQLVAESSGKQGHGIIPVDGEPLGTPDLYGSDRLFIYLRQEGRYDQAVSKLGEAGHPVLTFDVKTDDLGAEFYRWCVAVAVACIILNVNAFDQPDVQDSKTRTLAKIDAYRRAGKLEEGQPLWESEGVRLYGSALSVPISMGEEPVTLADILTVFLAQARSGDYVALNAYLPRNRQIGSALRRLRSAIMKRTHLATTIGFGPRFLHSTGQLHKGGPNNGLFIQITADPVEDVIIPEEGISFATLERAQALGDLESLIARGRRVVRVHLSNPQLLMKVAEIFK
jgi:transaldolase/glucose-6-phosphate isomerase